VAMVPLFDWAETFGLATQDRAKAVKYYRQAMSEIPADLVNAAVKRVTTGWKWGNRMPLPSDLRDAVPDAYADRKLALMNLDRAIEKRKER